MILSPRLECILDNILPDLALADIGTDHARIPIELIKRDILDSVIATDINSLPLNRARDEITNNQLNDVIELRLGAGLRPIKKDEISQVVIAGMGGEEIASILEEDIEKVRSLKQLILQPMTKVSKLRKFLLENDLLIKKEYTVKEGKHFYQILVVENKEVNSFNSYELEYGYLPAITIDENYLEYIKFEIELLENRIKNMYGSKNTETIRRRHEFQRRLIYLKEFYESIKNSSNN